MISCAPRIACIISRLRYGLEHTWLETYISPHCMKNFDNRPCPVHVFVSRNIGGGNTRVTRLSCNSLLDGQLSNSFVLKTDFGAERQVKSLE